MGRQALARWVVLGGFGAVIVLGAAGGGALLPGHPQPPAFHGQGQPGLIVPGGQGE